jgi:hypothetical protein
LKVTGNQRYQGCDLQSTNLSFPFREESAHRINRIIYFCLTEADNVDSHLATRHDTGTIRQRHDIKCCYHYMKWACSNPTTPSRHRHDTDTTPTTFERIPSLSVTSEPCLSWRYEQGGPTQHRQLLAVCSLLEVNLSCLLTNMINTEQLVFLVSVIPLLCDLNHPKYSDVKIKEKELG